MAVTAEAHLPLVKSIARRLHRPHGLPLEDLVQEGCFGLMYAAQRFDEGKGVRFSTFAAPAIRWFMLRALRDDRRPETETQSLKVADETEIPADPEPDPAVADEIRALLNCLSDKDRQVIEMRFGLHEGGEMKPKEIAERLGVSRQWVEFVIARSMKRMRFYADLPVGRRPRQDRAHHQRPPRRGPRGRSHAGRRELEKVGA